MPKPDLKAPKPQPLYPTETVDARQGRADVSGREGVKGPDGRYIYPGIVVRRLATTWCGVAVPEKHGRVRRLYRQPGLRSPSGCDVTVETECGRYFWADQCVRSNADEIETQQRAADKARREASTED